MRFIAPTATLNDLFIKPFPWAFLFHILKYLQTAINRIPDAAAAEDDYCNKGVNHTTPLPLL